MAPPCPLCHPAQEAAMPAARLNRSGVRTGTIRRQAHPMPRITSNPPIVPVRSTEIEETAGKPGTIDTAPTAPVQPGTSSDKHIESGIRKLEETGIEQSILRANGSKGLHLVPRFDPSRLVAEIRPDRRNGRERFFENWFGPKYR